MPTRVRNADFNRQFRFSLGRPRWHFAIWQLIKSLFFLTAFPWPSWIKVWILNSFGGRIGRHVYIKPRVNIHIPWKLVVGDHTWIGEEVSIVNLELVLIGDNCCISQRVLVCAGNHDYRRLDMAYRNAEITIGDGVWIGAQSFVGPGIVIGDEAVVTAGSIVTRSLSGGMVCSGNPCAPIRVRW